MSDAYGRTPKGLLDSLMLRLDLLERAFRRRTPGSWIRAGRAGAVTGGTITTTLTPVAGTTIAISLPYDTVIRGVFTMLLMPSPTDRSLTIQVQVDGVSQVSFPYASAPSTTTVVIPFEWEVPQGEHQIRMVASIASGTLDIVSRGAGQASTTSLSLDYLAT